MGSNSTWIMKPMCILYAVLCIMLMPYICIAGSMPTAEIYALNQSIQGAGTAQVLLVLPAKNNKFTKWEMHFPGHRMTPLITGNLSDNAEICKLKIELADPGTHKIILVIVDEKNEPSIVKETAVKVESGLLLKASSNSIGVMLGAMIAIIVFILQNEIKERSDTK